MKRILMALAVSTGLAALSALPAAAQDEPVMLDPCKPNEVYQQCMEQPGAVQWQCMLLAREMFALFCVGPYVTPPPTDGGRIWPELP